MCHLHKVDAVSTRYRSETGAVEIFIPRPPEPRPKETRSPYAGRCTSITALDCVWLTEANGIVMLIRRRSELVHCKGIVGDGFLSPVDLITIVESTPKNALGQGQIPIPSAMLYLGTINC